MLKMKHKEIALISWNLLKKTYQEFDDDNAIKLSASLSYYTIFSLPPLLIIIMSIFSVFFGREAVTGRFFGQINGMVGNEAAIQIQETIKNIELSDSNTFAAIFAEIQSSINSIWGLKAKPDKGFIKFIKNRLMSFSMIASVGFLLLVSLMVNTVMDIINARLLVYFPDTTIYLFYVLNILVLFATTTILFSIIFKTLPDGYIAWKDALIGSSLHRFYLGSSTVATVYGAAGSVIIILIWVYYSAIILYFGAEFTKVYSNAHGNKIIPNDYTVSIKLDVIELPKK
jgi:membrane protein